MPSTSKKQHNFMEAVAHNPSFAKKVGVPQSVGQDFATADKGKKFAKGGRMAGKMNAGFMAMMAKKKGASKDMPTKKMASGGYTRAADGIAQKGKTKAKQIKMAYGGKC